MHGDLRAQATASPNARFFAGDVRLALRELVDEASRPDVCVIDPPRAGLSQKVVRRVVPVDMFPQTPHIECVALLERG